MNTTRTEGHLASGEFHLERGEIVLAIALVLLVFIARKAYLFLELEDLEVLLLPSAMLIELITNSSFTFLQGTGYAFNDLGIIMDRSCGGGHFMITLLGLLVWWSRSSIIKHPWLPFLLITVALAFTIIGNVMRVLCSLIAIRIDLTGWIAKTPTAHQWMGILVQLALILIAHVLFRTITRKSANVTNA
jgi:exosortase K